MIQKITIKQIWIDKTPTQYGSFKTNFKCKEYGDIWLSGFAKSCNWKEGDVIELDIIDSETMNNKTGKPFKNWKFVSQEKKLEDKVAQLDFGVSKHDGQIKEIQEFLREAFPHKFKKEVKEDGRNSDGSLPPNFDIPTVIEPTDEELNEIMKL